MKKNVNVITQGQYSPGAFITKGKQRIKQYDNTVYLTNGDEFEIELFNPTLSKVLAQISVNGKSLGSGIILRPGERVFLERYLDESRKFLFETYDVNMNNPDVLRAIANNGSVSVEFYEESSFFGPVITTGGSPTWTYFGGYVEPTFTDLNKRANNFYSTSDNVSFTTYASSFTVPSAGGIICGNLGIENEKSFNQAPISASINMSSETGRVEKGSRSKQSFINDYSSFNTWWTWKTEWKILPISQKPLVKEDLNVYCTNCGAKRKKVSHKFCPQCGTKF